ncbi:MAG: 3-hydroxyacyl-CoA dehydrogenase [Xanthomonadales bacterium]|nr:3-hydroxyacyl-CoA dehydrogenase [Xanthomonadales bacterium]
MSEFSLGGDVVVAVVGAGAMGAGIAQIAAQSGHQVLLYDAKQGAAQTAIDSISKQLAVRVERAKLSEGQRSQTLRCLRAVDSIEAIAGSALVVEAIVEKLEAKRELFALLESVLGDEVVFATNTSSISITSIAAGLRRPERVVGMHFFNPAVVMPLVEVVSGAATDIAVAEGVFQLAGQWGKTPVHAKSTPGFIVNRVARPFYAEGLRLYQEGVAAPETLDAIIRVCGGFRMGPFELMDLIGHDVNYSVTRSVFDGYYGDPRFAPSLVQLELVNAGFLGRKTGRGFYNYADSSRRPDPAVEPSTPPPSSEIVVNTSHPVGSAISKRLIGGGLNVVEFSESTEQDWIARFGAAVVAMTDGRSASQRAAESSIDQLILLDLLLDPEHAKGIAISSSAKCSASGRQVVVGMLQAAGFDVYSVADSPGLVVMRTVAMLANEACDAVHQAVCTPAAVDVAMRGGVNYPKGPIAWAAQLGADVVLGVVDHLYDHYREPRYRASPRLRELQWTGANIYE